MFDGMNSTASALTAQRLRMDTAAGNMANASATRGRMVDGEWEPYRRKMVTMAPQDNRASFASHLQDAERESAGGVQVTGIVEDQTPFQSMHQPGHPDADEDGNVQLPNVDPLKEMVDVMGATRSYEANVTVFDAHKSMKMSAMEIGRG
ncbi:flagellar basal body rod protein FlgC [Salicibibacter halophilus]|uniref:Flagellar basal-body rod protein FlgC n=1 Tax=Salicibibacter halophilus TaxID=2502791 RepID=A0A514LM73_9BACI|nr:flagellar basal body rod protein FlgC [Salicibibacter halophilus]QDI92969.1 flagellar basal body rod protein FlgC [Salicibibacter halophilus]